MADLKISQLPSASIATGSNVLPIVQGGVTDQITVTNLAQGMFNLGLPITGSLLGTASYATYAANGGVTQIIAGGGISASPTSGTGSVTITGLAATYNTSTGSYGSFFDTGSYSIASAAAIYSMSFSNTSITNGVYISGSDKTKVYFSNPGIYNLQFSAQFDNSDATLGADVDIWFKQGNGNGVSSDIASSDSQITVPPKKAGVNGKIIAAWNLFISAAANDYVQIIYNGTTTVSLVTYAATGTHPQVPCVIATANRVDTFLSNTGSFSGSLNGATIDNTAWTSYTPTWDGEISNPTIGNGTITGAYKVIGKTCFVRVKINFGTTTSGGSGAWRIGLPFTGSTSDGIQMPCSLLDNGVAWYQGTVNGTYSGFTYKTAIIAQASGSNASQGVSSIFPFTWGNADSLQFAGSYEIA
jgi:hypothetical protein